MKIIDKNLGHISIGSKVTIVLMLVFGILFTFYNVALNKVTSKMVHERSAHEMSNITGSVVNSIEVFDKTVGQQINRFSQVFVSMFSKDFSIDKANKIQVGDKLLPALKNNNETISMNFEKIDEFNKSTGVIATFFVKDGEDFIRVSTSVKDEKGNRAISTILAHESPAYTSLQSGREYTGVSQLFGKYYSTNYRPLTDNKGNIIGAVFVGLDVSSEMTTLKESIKKIKVGTTGYVFIMDANKNNKTYGTVLLHPVAEGHNLLETKDSSGHYFIKEILEKGTGSIQYPWMNKERNETVAKDKVVAFETYKNWNWLIGSGTYVEELTGDMTSIYNIFTFIGIGVLVILSVVLYVVLKNMITKPLMAAKNIANRLAQGDLTQQVNTNRSDEIGDLLQSINNISINLAKVVGTVRTSTDQIQTASREIADGNNDLSIRTEQQAASLEETATSMEELTSIIKNNAEQAMSASKLVTDSSNLAVKGGQSMKQVVNKMEEINQSSKKIVDIISVIDSIAFQTNILALNAAVEAARAGEQGRGFAVVASEVRNLAQRSASAAKEIKGLINDSVDNINQGNQFVNQAEFTIEEIVNSVNNVNTIMKEIAQANHEQSVGVEQINRAISQMDGVTQQNAALVEEAAAAATSMQELSVELSETVSAFKIK